MPPLNRASSNNLLVCYYKITLLTELPNVTFPMSALIERTDAPNLTSVHHRLARYGPLVLWAVLIFIGSTSLLSSSHTAVLMRPVLWLFPHASQSKLKLFHLIIR